MLDITLRGRPPVPWDRPLRIAAADRYGVYTPRRGETDAGDGVLLVRVQLTGQRGTREVGCRERYQPWLCDN
jgi:hypothetical protein